MMPPLTQEFVKSILDYDPKTGIFRWKTRSDVLDRWNKRNAGKIAGSTTYNGYVVIQIGKRLHYKAHVLAWLYVYGEWCPGEIDHKLGDRSDNRINELRKADESDNGCNKAMQRNNKSGFVGVHFDSQRGKWRAKINRRGSVQFDGFFDTAEAANSARQKALVKIQGEFAPQNPDRPKYPHHRDRGH
jgi:HNH endonuclease